MMYETRINVDHIGIDPLEPFSIDSVLLPASLANSFLNYTVYLLPLDCLKAYHDDHLLWPQ